jgi:hypothetical protein
MRKFKNMMNQALPIELKSGGICVAANAYFSIDGDDALSPDLSRLAKAGRIRLVEETVVHAKDKTEEVIQSDRSTVVPEAEFNVTEIKFVEDKIVETSGEEKSEESIGDTLTTALESVESSGEVEETDSSDEDSEKHRRKKSKKRGFSL